MNDFDAVKNFFDSGATRSLAARILALEAIKHVLKKNESRILQALHEDLGKPEFEAYLGEIGFLYEEIRFTVKHLKKWMEPQRVRTPLTMFPAKSEIHFEPKGPILVLAPWNYPIQLAIAPLIAALAAGNTAILKPSELAPNCAELLKEIFSTPELSSWIKVLCGDAQVAQELLRLPFRHFFFTGGERVGIIVMKAAAEQLAGITLELGGKSPVLIHSDADLALAARRIVWGKFYNAGQTCVAPDYALVDAQVERAFLAALKMELERNFSDRAEYARIVNRNHFLRLHSFLQEGEILWGGNSDPENLWLEPTILRPRSLDCALMKEEIFGPLLPIVAVSGYAEMQAIIARNPEPLALYAFGKNPDYCNQALRIRAGGFCWNDVVIQLGNPNLPFGGAGKSGIGAYHGRHGFEEFSHKKSVVIGSARIDPPIRYRPYKKNLPWIRRLFK